MFMLAMMSCTMIRTNLNDRSLVGKMVTTDSGLETIQQPTIKRQVWICKATMIAAKVLPTANAIRELTSDHVQEERGRWRRGRCKRGRREWKGLRELSR